jgi:hypothetical protein
VTSYQGVKMADDIFYFKRAAILAALMMTDDILQLSGWLMTFYT